MTQQFQWARKHQGAYEVSSAGDKRFSAMHAEMPDKRTIEMWYQCDVKGYQPGGTDWRLGKGKKPLIAYPGDDGLYDMYLSLWKLWAITHPRLIMELAVLARQHGSMLTDCFANTNVNQARALAQILNEWFPEYGLKI
jgi:hypothetical protein